MILCSSLLFLNYVIPIKQGMAYRITHRNRYIDRQISLDKMISNSNITCTNSRYYFSKPKTSSISKFEKLQFPVLRRKQIACQVSPNSDFQYWFSSFQVSTLKDVHLFHAQRQEKHYPD